MAKVNIINIIGMFLGGYFQLARVILKEGVTRISHIWQFLGFIFWSLTEENRQVLGVVNPVLGG